MNRCHLLPSHTNRAGSHGPRQASSSLPRLYRAQPVCAQGGTNKICAGSKDRSCGNKAGNWTAIMFLLLATVSNRRQVLYDNRSHLWWPVAKHLVPVPNTRVSFTHTELQRWTLRHPSQSCSNAKSINVIVELWCSYNIFMVSCHLIANVLSVTAFLYIDWICSQISQLIRASPWHWTTLCSDIEKNGKDNIAV